ncbi:hypothetical protein HMPREF1249_1033 [Jonquetella sp. BV3C21]|nr:hypothetical protein HMPREF1249_1033 [Jonquetella sp. BV3C21]
MPYRFSASEGSISPPPSKKMKTPLSERLHSMVRAKIC